MFILLGLARHLGGLHQRRATGCKTGPLAEGLGSKWQLRMVVQVQTPARADVVRSVGVRCIW